MDKNLSCRLPMIASQQKNRQITLFQQFGDFLCEPVGSRTPIEGTGILYSIH